VTISLDDPFEWSTCGRHFTELAELLVVKGS